MKGLDEEPTDGGYRPGNVTNGEPVTHKSPMSLLQSLRLCQGAWEPGSPWDRHGAHAALWGRAAGSFLVVPEPSSQTNVLCVSEGGQGETVRDFPIQQKGTALHLSTSRLTFPDLLHLVVFYTFSRDVLPLCLSVPVWVHTLTERPEHLLPQFGPKSWLCPALSDFQTDPMTPGTQDTPDAVMCSIQLTTASGALCIINPLYLHEHGDDWLTRPSPVSQPANRSTNFKRDRRLSTTRPWGGAGLKKRGVSLDEASHSSDSSGLASSTDIASLVTTAEGVVLRRSSSSSNQPDPVRRGSMDSINSPLPQSPHRVSWVEDKVWLTPPPPSSLLHLPCLELDALSISSIEEEHEPEPEPLLSPTPSPHSPRPTRPDLANKVRNRLSAVGQALGGFMSPQRRLSKRVQEMSERKGGAFAEAVRGFVDETLKAGSAHGVGTTEMLQEVRSSLTALRETLYDYAEIQSIIDSMGEVMDFELDAMLELALHKVALKPVYSHLYVQMKTVRRWDGTLQRLQENQRTLSGRPLEELEGTAGAGLPDAVMLDKIQQRWATMHQAYSPNKKVDTLLKVCKNIYHSMSANAKPGVVFGADDFLPCLTWVLLRSDVATLQTDTDYMMEMLDPSQLQGEGGYYLTSLYAALFYISSFRPRLAVRQLSAEAHKSLSQWHRRRTLHCNQSRRSRNRRTIRRVARSNGLSESSTETEGDSPVQRTDSGKSNDAADDDDVDAEGMKAIKAKNEDLEAVGEEEEEEEGESEERGKKQVKEGKKMNSKEV